MAARRRKFWGWGLEGDGLTEAEIKSIDSAWANRFGAGNLQVTPAPTPEEIELSQPRIAIPTSLKEFCTTDHYER